MRIESNFVLRIRCIAETWRKTPIPPHSLQLSKRVYPSSRDCGKSVGIGRKSYKSQGPFGGRQYTLEHSSQIRLFYISGTGGVCNGAFLRNTSNLAILHSSSTTCERERVRTRAFFLHTSPIRFRDRRGLCTGAFFSDTCLTNLSDKGIRTRACLYRTCNCDWQNQVIARKAWAKTSAFK